MVDLDHLSKWWLIMDTCIVMDIYPVCFWSISVMGIQCGSVDGVAPPGWWTWIRWWFSCAGPVANRKNDVMIHRGWHPCFMRVHFVWKSLDSPHWGGSSVRKDGWQYMTEHTSIYQPNGPTAAKNPAVKGNVSGGSKSGPELRDLYEHELWVAMNPTHSPPMTTQLVVHRAHDSNTQRFVSLVVSDV